jgi:low temperature requirement protein LtrA
MVSRMFSPPRLRLPEQEDGRRATWLELFYDLVFVVAVGAIGGRLFKHASHSSSSLSSPISC